LYLTKSRAITHIVNHGRQVAWISYESKLKFNAKYSVGQRWQIGEVEGIVVKIEYREEEPLSMGLITFRIEAEVNLKES